MGPLLQRLTPHSLGGPGETTRVSHGPPSPSLHCPQPQASDPLSPPFWPVSGFHRARPRPHLASPGVSEPQPPEEGRELLEGHGVRRLPLRPCPLHRPWAQAPLRAKRRLNRSGGTPQRLSWARGGRDKAAVCWAPLLPGRLLSTTAFLGRTCSARGGLSPRRRGPGEQLGAPSASAWPELNAEAAKISPSGGKGCPYTAGAGTRRETLCKHGQ